MRKFQQSTERSLLDVSNPIDDATNLDNLGAYLWTVHGCQNASGEFGMAMIRLNGKPFDVLEGPSLFRARINASHHATRMIH